MSNFKDFVGINICIYDPILEDSGAIGVTTFGYDPKSSLFYRFLWCRKCVAIDTTPIRKDSCIAESS